MGELESIEKLVDEYTPRIEAILGMEIGNVKVKEHSGCVMETCKDTIYVNLKRLSGLKQAYPEIEKGEVAHELTHILSNNNNLRAAIWNRKIERYMDEGFAEYVAWEFPEIYQNEKLIERIKGIRKERTELFQNAEPKIKELLAPYIKGYRFFKKVGDEIGKENVLKVFQNLPQSMEEILQPELYLQRIEGGSNGFR